MKTAQATWELCPVVAVLTAMVVVAARHHGVRPFIEQGCESSHCHYI